MAIYWDQPSTDTSKSTGTKLIAAIIIVMIVLSAGLFAIFQLLPAGIPGSTEEGVRIAIIDSGLDQDFSTSGRVAAAQSFISPQYGYDFTDSDTGDSNPDDGYGNRVRHGTMVAQAIVQNSDSALLVIAKVIDTDGSATASALIAAMYWVIEQNCSVINLSLGSSPTVGDPLEDMVEYAHSLGIIVVAAAGNEGNNGVPGTSLSSPSVYLNAISVAALDDNGEPAGYSSQGPTVDRYMKPDIATEGFVETSTAIYYGTSFAAPKVSAFVAELIEHCIQNGYDYTPGSITAALLEGALDMEYPEYVVGAGEANLAQAKYQLDNAGIEDNLPRITHIDVDTLPLEFETLYQGENYTFNIEIVTSALTTFSVDTFGIPDGVVDMPSTIIINQSAIIPVTVHVPMSDAPISGDILFDSAFDSQKSIELTINPQVPNARIAFDITHTTWSIDSVYGQFKDLYIYLTENDLSITEIRDRELLTAEYLSNFDAVFILDPCAWDLNETDFTNPDIFSIPFTQEETDAYEAYFQSGGGIFVTALSNDSLDLESLNDFLGWAGVSLGNPSIPAFGTYASVSSIDAHPITAGVTTFDYNGATITSNTSYTDIAQFGGSTVLSVFEGSTGGRIVITGTNFFIDNWGIRGLYDSSDNDLLSLRIALWLSGLL